MHKSYLILIALLSITINTAASKDSLREIHISDYTNQFSQYIYSFYDSLNLNFLRSNQTLSGASYDQKRQELIEEANAAHFTVDVPELTKEEKEVDSILHDLRGEIVQGDHSPLLLQYYEGKTIIQDSNLHQAFQKMPKGAHLHLHPAAAFPIDLVMDLTRGDDAYYSMEKNLLRTYSEGEAPADYTQCNYFRKNWDQEGTFDEFILNKLLLTAEDMASQESNQIWANFQPKFSLLSGLFHSPENLKLGLMEICKRALADGIFIVEFRKGLSGNYQQKLDLYQSVLTDMKKIDPDFEITLIIAPGKTDRKSVV